MKYQEFFNLSFFFLFILFFFHSLNKLYLYLAIFFLIFSLKSLIFEIIFSLTDRITFCNYKIKIINLDLFDNLKEIIRYLPEKDTLYIFSIKRNLALKDETIQSLKFIICHSLKDNYRYIVTFIFTTIMLMLNIFLKIFFNFISYSLYDFFKLDILMLTIFNIVMFICFIKYLFNLENYFKEIIDIKDRVFLIFLKTSNKIVDISELKVKNNFFEFQLIFTFSFFLIETILVTLR